MRGHERAEGVLHLLHELQRALVHGWRTGELERARVPKSFLDRFALLRHLGGDGVGRRLSKQGLCLGVLKAHGLGVKHEHYLWIDAHDLLQRVEGRQRAQPVLQHAYRLVARGRCVDRRSRELVAPRAQQRERAARVVAAEPQRLFGLERAIPHIDESRDLIVDAITPVHPRRVALVALSVTLVARASVIFLVVALIERVAPVVGAIGAVIVHSRYVQRVQVRLVR